MLEIIKNIFISLRPKQWIKNLFVFVALVFSKSFMDGTLVWKTLGAFALFCLVSSAVYIINDIADYEYDRLHPKKKFRPIAAGKISRSGIFLFSLFLLIIAFYFAVKLNQFFGILLIGYFSLNLLYSFGLKNVVGLDVILVAAGFVLRAIGGGLAIAVKISPWLIVCTFLLTLFMSLAKRRQEIFIMKKNGGEITRKVLGNYNLKLIDQMINIVTPSTFIAYVFYTFSAEHSVYMMATIPAVLYGLFRYLYLVYKKELGEDPTTVAIKDRALQITVMVWVIMVVAVLGWLD